MTWFINTQKIQNVYGFNSELTIEFLPQTICLKISIINEDACTFCQNEPETLFHLFCKCEIIKHFWLRLQNNCKEQMYY